MSRHALILLAVAGLTFFLGLGRSAIGDSDEAFYAEAAREMVESGNWLTPYYNYELRFQKPILYYWLAAAAYRGWGLGEAAARIPSALSGVGLVLLTWLAARRWFGPGVGLIAGLIVATNFGYYAIGRMALPDLPLAFFISLATWAGIESISAGREGQPRTRAWLMLAAVASGLAVLMKGPVGVALPLLVACVLLVLPRRPGTPWMPWSWRDLAWASAVLAAVAAPWYLAMAREHGIGYLHHFFVGENLDRFATDRYNDPRPLWFYVPIVLGGLLPWSPFMAPWVRTGWRVLRRARPLAREEWWLLAWAAVPLLFYSLSIGKQPRYVLPILPPLAVLLARSIHWRIASPGDGPSPSCGAPRGCRSASPRRRWRRSSRCTTPSTRPRASSPCSAWRESSGPTGRGRAPRAPTGCSCATSSSTRA
ncbi:MAG: glycosyltransferase family 39 protein [Vicinamibacterales bacterium]|nr:glycosyltransferase family 39 protein [Vicinamibacterales bacterium]